LNGTRRQSLSDPTPMTPGEIYELDIPMRPTGWVVQQGHRLRLAISSSDFPNLWPTPLHARNRVYRAAAFHSRLVLPVVPESKVPPPHFLPSPSLHQVVTSSPLTPTQQVLNDQISGEVTILNNTGYTSQLADDLGRISYDCKFRCTASSKNPALASVLRTHQFIAEREDGLIDVTAETLIRATVTAFHIVINLNVTRNDRPFFTKTWTISEPRRLL